MPLVKSGKALFFKFADGIFPGADARRLAIRGIAEHPVLFAAGVLATAAVVACNMIEPQLVRLMVDDAIQNKNLGLLALLAPLWLALFSVAHLILLGRTQAVARLTQDTAKKLRLELFELILDLPPSFHTCHDAADLNLQVTKDLDDFGPLWGVIPLSVLWYLLTVVASISLALLISAKLTFYLGAVIVVLSLAWRAVTRGATRNAVGARTEFSLLSSTAHRALSRIRLVQLYDAQPVFLSHFGQASDRLRDRRVRHGIWTWLAATVGDAMEVSAMIGVLAIGGAMCVRGELTVGALFSYFLYINYLSQAFMHLANQLAPLSVANAAGGRIAETLAHGRGRRESRQTLTIDGPIAALSVSNLSFGYETANPVLKNVNATFAKGSVCLLWGQNASGKTTLLDILCGYRQPDSGTVSVNGRDLRRLCQKQFRSRLAIIAQEDVVVEYTVEENLRFGKPNASKAQLRGALEEVLLAKNAADAGRMLKLHAENLSTGQKRRIAIARAFLRGADIVLLDEPTANLDEQSVDVVLDCLVNLARNSVVVMTTQDPRAASISQNNYLLTDGKIQPAEQSLRAAGD